MHFLFVITVTYRMHCSLCCDWVHTEVIAVLGDNRVTASPNRVTVCSKRRPCFATCPPVGPEGLRVAEISCGRFDGNHTPLDRQLVTNHPPKISFLS